MNKFLEECALKGYKSLDSLNAAYTAWQWEYNNSPHSSLNGKTPCNTFDSDKTELRMADPEHMAKAFCDTGLRIVQKDGTISIDGRKYIVDNLNLIGFQVAYSRMADETDNAMVFCRGFSPCMARALVIGEDIDFEARNRSISKGVIECETSRFLDGLEKKYEEDHPGVELARDAKDIPAPASFASIARKEDKKK